MKKININFLMKNVFFQNKHYSKKLLINLKNNSFLKFNFSTKLNQNQYIDEVQLVLENINDSLEELELDIIDVNFDNSGILNFQVTDQKKFVLNIQRPNQQLWLSSPISGPFRFEFDLEKNKWLDVKNNIELYQLLKSDIDKIFKDNNINTSIKF